LLAYEKQMSAPCSAKRSAIALPIPREPPVTTADLPDRSITRCSLSQPHGSAVRHLTAYVEHLTGEVGLDEAQGGGRDLQRRN
jgi:hypothetical protein